MIYYKASVAQICVLFRFNDRQWSLTNPWSPKKCFYLVSMIVNDLLQILGRPTNVFIWSLWSSMISYKASDAQICVFLDSMIVNDLSQSLGRPNNISIWSLWSSMITYKASVSQICVLFRLNDRQWSLTKPRSPKYVSYLDSMIVNDLLQILGCPTNVFIWSLMIVNDLLQSLGRPNMRHFRLYDRQWSLTKPRSHKYVSYMAFYDCEWSFMKPWSPKYVSYLDSMIVNDLLQCLSRLNICLIWTQWSSMFF